MQKSWFPSDRELFHFQHANPSSYYYAYIYIHSGNDVARATVGVQQSKQRRHSPQNLDGAKPFSGPSCLRLCKSAKKKPYVRTFRDEKATKTDYLPHPKQAHDRKYILRAGGRLKNALAPF